MTDIDKRIEEIKKRVEAASPEPWAATLVFPGTATDPAPHGLLHGPRRVQVDRTYQFCVGNADFIANARQDIPWLLDELAKARRVNEAGEKAISACRNLITATTTPVETCRCEFCTSARDALQTYDAAKEGKP